MINSYNKTQDIEMRMLTLENMEICLKHGLVERAKELGLVARRLKHKIDTHNYTKEDAQTARINARLKLCQISNPQKL
jgi:hypothetical protein